MSRPDAFCRAYVALQNTPYLCKDGSTHTRATSHSGGVLGRGDLVWTRDDYSSGQDTLCVDGFVEHAGLVSLNPRFLVRADALKPLSEGSRNT